MSNHDNQMSQIDLQTLLDQSASLHNHLCPRQVLGVRMGLWAGELLTIAVPQARKRLLTIVETDGCFTDGVAVATNCWVGRRTMRVVDYGKVAATFVDTETGTAWRIAPRAGCRLLARNHVPDARNRWLAMLTAYQIMPTDELFTAQRVTLQTPIAAIISRAGYRVNCEECGEEILNEREREVHGRVLCRFCTGGGYYRLDTERR